MRNNGRILVCDDQAILRAIMEGVVKECWPGAEVTQATNGREAYETASHQMFDLIFMDVEMPFCNGFEAVKLIRESSKNLTTPIVMCTAYTEEEISQRGWRLGADRLLTKPFDPDKVYRILEEVKWGDYELVS